jgi:hypothetical protein
MAKIPLYQALARKLAWKPPSGSDFEAQRADEIKRLSDLLPHGSGIDGTVWVELDERKRLHLGADFHHMNHAGYYDGWTEHEVIVSPSLEWDFELRITGSNRNDVKSYLHEVYDHALRELVEEYAPKEEPCSQ